jgi:hypothetical protein
MNLEWFDDESVLPSALLTELDEHTRALFKQLCRLHCGIQLVRFLIENKHTLATVEGIAYHLNEPPVKVDADVQELANLGLVRQVEVADLALFGLTMDSNRRQSMHDLYAWQERWQVRLSRIERAIDGKAVRQENSGTYTSRGATGCFRREVIV